MEESKIVYGKSGIVTLVGQDATRLFSAAVLKSAIELLKVGIQPTRGYTMKKALSAAGLYTGKIYKRGEAERAIADLRVWIANMKSALPTEEQR